jgi:hypothetical protein
VKEREKKKKKKRTIRRAVETTDSVVVVPRQTLLILIVIQSRTLATRSVNAIATGGPGSRKSLTKPGRFLTPKKTAGMNGKPRRYENGRDGATKTSWFTW